MTHTDAVNEAVKHVEATGATMYILRRGSKYKASSLIHWHGWKVAEMIGPGNVQNFKVIS